MNNGFTVSSLEGTEPIGVVRSTVIVIIGGRSIELSPVTSSEGGACVGNHLGKVCAWGSEEVRDDFPCSEEFGRAWDAWDRADELAMPTLRKEPCLLVRNYHNYICSEELRGCARE